MARTALHLTTAALAILVLACGAAAAAALHVEDRAILLYALEVNLTQVRLGQLVAEKAQDERVHQFARRMVEHHEGSYDRLAQLARENGIEPLQDAGPSAQRTQELLQQLTGPLFDWEYITTEVIQHNAAFYRYERAAIHGRREPVRALAAQAFRNVKEHHDAALEIVRGWNWGRPAQLAGRGSSLDRPRRKI